MFATWGSGPDDVWAAGPLLAQFLHWNGAKWELVTSGMEAYGLWGTASDDVYAVGYGIVHWNGEAWGPPMPMPDLGENQLLDVWGSASDQLYAVGTGGNILEGDGVDWTSMTSGTTEVLWGVAGAGSDDIFAVGDAGTILHGDGDTWSPMSSGTTVSLRDVWASPAGGAIAVGEEGTILHWDGRTWSARASGTTLTLQAVDGTGPADVYAVGDAGTVLHWDGAGWSRMAMPTTRAVLGVWAGAEVFAAAGATLLRRPRLCLPDERRCADGGDDDCDGLVDCADPHCSDDPWCAGGGACAGAATLACDTSVDGSTAGADRRFDRYGCDPWFEVGGEAIYRITPGASGDVTVTLADLNADLDLLVLASLPGGACEPRDPGCLGASSTTGDETVTFAAEAGADYYVVVDGYGGDSGSFQLAVDCP
jgi:hypothetical protein